MPRTCTICADARVAEVDRQLVSGTSLRNIAEQFRLAVTSLHRHMHGHVPVALAKARDAQKVADAEGLLGQIQKLTVEARKIKSMAGGQGRSSYCPVSDPGVGADGGAVGEAAW